MFFVESQRSSKLSDKIIVQIVVTARHASMLVY